MADDIGYDNYSIYGSTDFSTPNLDTLAESGTYFSRAYSTPVCTPSRVRIMTGRDGSRNYESFGVLPTTEITFAAMMKQAGYASAITGKWQLQTSSAGTAVEDAGFDTWLMNNTLSASKSGRYWKPELEQDDGTLLPGMTATDYCPDKCTDFVIDFITAHTNEPFFVYYPMLLVHDPFLTTPDSVDPSENNENINYRDMVKYMDKMIGRIVQSLEDLGLREDTVIIYTGDNGTGRSIDYVFNGESRSGEKAYPTDGGTHVALIANCPGTITSGYVCDDLVDFTDILPTMADIAQTTLPNRVLDGQSFWPQLQGETGTPKDVIYQYYVPKNSTVKTIYGSWIQWAQDEQYKLYNGKNIFHFYDYINDRAEENPLTITNLTAEQQIVYDKLLSKILEMENAMVAGPLETSPTDTYDSANANLSVLEAEAPVITFTRRYDTSIETIIEASSLTNSVWQNVSANFTLIGRTNNGDGTEDVTYKMMPPTRGKIKVSEGVLKKPVAPASSRRGN
jgi:arylsulfatase A